MMRSNRRSTIKTHIDCGPERDTLGLLLRGLFRLWAWASAHPPKCKLRRAPWFRASGFVFATGACSPARAPALWRVRIMH